MILRGALCVVVTLALAGFASASIIQTMSLVYDGSYDSGWNPLGQGAVTTTSTGNGTNQYSVALLPGAMYHQFDVYVAVSGLLAGQDIDAIQYQGITGGGATNEQGYSGYNASISPPSMGPPTSHAPTAATFFLNFANLNTSTLETFVQQATHGADTAGSHGNDWGDYAADIYGNASPANFYGLGAGPAAYDLGTLTITDTAAGGTFAFSFQANPGYFAVDNGNTNGAALNANQVTFPAYTGYGDSVVFTPEPSTLALLASGLVGLLCYAWRKRK